MHLGRGLASALATTMLLASIATAADKPRFDQADGNGDGRVTIQEAEAAGIAPDKAKANDLNGDGELTRADWRFIDVDSKTDGGR